MEELSGKLLVIIIILIILQGIIRDLYVFFKKRFNNNKKIDVHEFDEIDINKMKEREAAEEEELKYETAVLNQIRNEADKNNNKFLSFDEVMERDSKIERAIKDFKSFKRLDSVEMEEYKIKEGSSIEAIKENRKDLEIEVYKAWSKELFKCIKIGTEEDINIIRKFLSEELYNSLIKQRKRLKDDNLNFVTEDLYIEDVRIIDYGKALEKETIKVLIDVNLKEYILDNFTRRIIKGDAENLYNRKYIMTFLKRETNLEEEGLIKNCPNCNAATNQMEFGKCRYCGTLVFPIRYNWTLIKFETL